jgi:hypothetical protein
MMVQVTRGELATIRNLLKDLMREDMLIEDLEGEIWECYDIVDNALKYNPVVSIPNE